MKLSDNFDCTEGGAGAVVGDGAVVSVDAAEMDDDEADETGMPALLLLVASPVKSDIIVDEDDFIESSMDAADDETDLYMDSNLDDILVSSVVDPDPELHVRSLDTGFLC